MVRRVGQRFLDWEWLGKKLGFRILKKSLQWLASRCILNSHWQNVQSHFADTKSGKRAMTHFPNRSMPKVHTCFWMFAPHTRTNVHFRPPIIASGCFQAGKNLKKYLHRSHAKQGNGWTMVISCPVMLPQHFFRLSKQTRLGDCIPRYFSRFVEIFN